LVLESSPNLYEYTVNFDLYRAKSKDRPRYVARYFYKLAWARLFLIRRVKWRPTPHHAKVFIASIVGMANDFRRAVMLRLLPGLYDMYSRMPDLASPFPADGEHLALPKHNLRHVPPLQGMGGTIQDKPEEETTVINVPEIAMSEPLEQRLPQ